MTWTDSMTSHEVVHRSSRAEGEDGEDEEPGEGRS